MEKVDKDFEVALVPAEILVESYHIQVFGKPIFNCIGVTIPETGSGDETGGIQFPSRLREMAHKRKPFVSIGVFVSKVDCPINRYFFPREDAAFIGDSGDHSREEPSST